MIRSRRISSMVLLPLAVISVAAMWWTTNRCAVNVFFWDEWDCYGDFFSGAGFIQQFAHQHGPHRMGWGMLVVELLNRATGWDSRAISYAALGFVALATFLAIKLRKRLFRVNAWTDISIVLGMLTLAQMETFVPVPCLSQVAIPSALLLSYCFCWTFRRGWGQVAAMLAIQGSFWFTGYGLTFIPACVIALVLNLFSHERRISIQRSWVLLYGIAISGLLFFQGYRTEAAQIEFHADKYFYFVSMLSATLCGLGRSWPGVIEGIMYFVALPFVAFGAARRMLARVNVADTTILILTLSVLGYIMVDAAGRSASGDGTLSHYATLTAVGYVGLYFRACQAGRYQKPVALILIALFLNGSILATRTIDQSPWYHYGEVKKQWKECYQKTGDIDQCNQINAPGIYPYPSATGLNEKIQFLKKNHLNLFKLEDRS